MDINKILWSVFLKGQTLILNFLQKWTAEIEKWHRIRTNTKQKRIHIQPFSRPTNLLDFLYFS